MKCPECGSPGLVTQSRFDGATKVRHRRCTNPDCGASYSSREFLTSKHTPDSVKAYIRLLAKGDALSTVERVMLQRKVG